MMMITSERCNAHSERNWLRPLLESKKTPTCCCDTTSLCVAGGAWHVRYAILRLVRELRRGATRDCGRLQRSSSAVCAEPHPVVAALRVEGRPELRAHLCTSSMHSYTYTRGSLLSPPPAALMGGGAHGSFGASPSDLSQLAGCAALALSGSQLVPRPLQTSPAVSHPRMIRWLSAARERSSSSSTPSHRVGDGGGGEPSTTAVAEAAAGGGELSTGSARRATAVARAVVMTVSSFGRLCAVATGIGAVTLLPSAAGGGV